MDWGKIIMDSFIVAIISAAALLLAAFITELFAAKRLLNTIKELKISDNFDKRKDEHDNLSQEHAELSKEHCDLSKEHKEIMHLSETNGTGISFVQRGVDDVRIKVDAIYTDIQVDKAQQQARYDSLTEKQRDVIGHLNSLQNLGNELQKLQFENSELKNDVFELKKESELTHNIHNRTIMELQQENKLLREELEAIRKQRSVPRDFNMDIDR